MSPRRPADPPLLLAVLVVVVVLGGLVWLAGHIAAVVIR